MAHKIIYSEAAGHHCGTHFQPSHIRTLCVPQAVKTLLSVSSLVSRGATIGDTQDKMTIKKNGVGIILETSIFQNKDMMFYLKAKWYSPEGQEALINLPEEKKDGNNEKQEWRKKLGL